jgi:hypothetical protein
MSSVPVDDLHLAVKRDETGFQMYVASDLRTEQFADLCSALIHHAATKLDVPPSQVFDMVRHMYAGEHERGRGGKVVVVDFKRGNP